MSDEQAFEREPESHDWESEKLNTTAQKKEDKEESKEWDLDKG